MCYTANKSGDAVGNNGHAVEQNRAVALLSRLWIEVFVMAGLSVTLLAGQTLRVAGNREAAIARAVREQVLASTIQIEMFNKSHVAQDVRLVSSNKGLATLVAIDDRQYIMTHNHWVLPWAELDRVELRDAGGELQVVLKGITFVSLVRYQDAGTLLFAAPPQLDGMTAAPLGDSSSLTPGDSLWITTRDKQQERIVCVIAATVEQAGQIDEPGQLRLHGPKTAVAAGDSGGGVWHNGRLVGNMWAVVRSLQETPWAWRGWFSTPKEKGPTGDYLIARQPLGSDSGPAAGRKKPYPFAAMGYEGHYLR